MTSIGVAVRGKGALNAARRGGTIARRYGWSAQRMQRRLDAVTAIIDHYGCGATLPVTGDTAEHNRAVIARYARLGVEFAVHGYFHVDHVGLPAAAQIEQFVRARQVLQECDAPAVGFRAPYLRVSSETLEAVRGAGFSYDGSEAVHWPVDPQRETSSYRRVLDFYRSTPALTRPVLPRFSGNLVRIPYCIPDDEAVVDRLAGLTPCGIARLWLGNFRQTHERGELFTLGVHPERIEACGEGVVAVLEAARAASPPAWIARLDEVAAWWRARGTATVRLQERPGGLRLDVRGPAGLTLLARGVQVGGGVRWGDGYVRVPGNSLEVAAGCRPTIAVTRRSSAALATFLQEQGYVVEVAQPGRVHGWTLDRPTFSADDERGVLDEIERGARTLVRLGRWPHGARSAVCLTGDVDALTLRDYAARLLGFRPMSRPQEVRG